MQTQGNPFNLFRQSTQCQLQQCQQLEMNTVMLIQQCSNYREQHKFEINSAKTEIDQVFNSIYNKLRYQQTQLHKELDNINNQNNTNNNHMLLSQALQSINLAKQETNNYLQLSEYGHNYSYESLMSSIIKMQSNFETARNNYMECVNLIQQNISKEHVNSITVNIDKDRVKQINARLQNLCNIKIDRKNVTESETVTETDSDSKEEEKQDELVIDEHAQTQKDQEQVSEDNHDGIDKTELEDKIVALENKLQQEKTKYKNVTQSLLARLNGYLKMEDDRNVKWYDSNCNIKSKPYQNYEAVYLHNKSNRMLDSKGKYRKIPENESLLTFQPNCVDLGEYVACINKLRNGYVKWIKDLHHTKIQEQAGNKSNNQSRGNAKTKRNDELIPDPSIISMGSRTPNRNNKTKGRKTRGRGGMNRNGMKRDRDIDAESWVNEYAKKKQMLGPQFAYLSHASKPGEIAIAQVSFAGQVFAAEGRKRQMARAMAFQMVMEYIMSNIE